MAGLSGVATAVSRICMGRTLRLGSGRAAIGPARIDMRQDREQPAPGGSTPANWHGFAISAREQVTPTTEVSFIARAEERLPFSRIFHSVKQNSADHDGTRST